MTLSARYPPAGQKSTCTGAAGCGWTAAPPLTHKTKRLCFVSFFLLWPRPSFSPPCPLLLPSVFFSSDDRRRLSPAAFLSSSTSSLILLLLLSRQCERDGPPVPAVRPVLVLFNISWICSCFSAVRLLFLLWDGMTKKN